MRSLIKLTSIILLMSTATPAWAFYEQPSTLLTAIQSRGGPRMFSFEVHGNIENELYFSIWAKGAHEGRTPQNTKAKLDATVDVVVADMKVRMRLKTKVYRQMLYARLESIDASGADPLVAFSTQLLQKKWIAIPVDAELYPDDSSNVFLEALMAILEGIGIEEDNVDSVFVMRHTRFANGFAYSIKPRPYSPRGHVLVYDDIPEKGMTLMEWLKVINGEWDEPAYSRPRQLEEHDTNIHIKIDANFNDKLLYSKFYISQKDMEEGWEFVIQGTLEHLPTPVYLDIPRDTISMEEWIVNVPALEDDLWILPLLDLPLGDWGLQPEEEKGYDWTKEVPSCERMRDRPEYVYLVRKGLCFEEQYRELRD